MNIKRILVSQPAPASPKSPYYDIAQKYGVEMVFRPFIKVEGLTGKEFRQQKINLATFTGVIFTARTAVDHFFSLCKELRVEVPATMKYFCTTESIALYLQKYIVYRKRKIFFGTSGKFDDAQLLQALTKHNKEVMLLPVSDVHKDNGELANLEKAGISYTKAVMYRTVSNDFQPDEKLDYDMLIFFSPVGIASLLKNFPNFDQEKENIKVACYGPATCKAAEEAGLKLDISAPSPKFPSMTGALENYLKEHA
jgi:uroporphyrinogen-III synthase